MRQGRTIHNTYLIQQYNTIRIIQQYARQATPAAVYNTVTVLGVKYTSDKVGGPNTPKYTTAAARVGSASGSSAASAVSINVGSGGCGGLWTLAADGLDFAQLGWGGGLAIIRPVLIQQYNTIRIIQQYSKIRRVLSYPGVVRGEPREREPLERDSASGAPQRPLVGVVEVLVIGDRSARRLGHGGIVLLRPARPRLRIAASLRQLEPARRLELLLARWQRPLSDVGREARAQLVEPMLDGMRASARADDCRSERSGRVDQREPEGMEQLPVLLLCPRLGAAPPAPVAC